MKKKEDPNQDKEIQKVVERYESMRKAGKTPYLDSEEFEDIADHYFNAGRFDEALAAINMGLLMHEEDTVLLSILALLRMERGETDIATAIVDRIIDRDDCPLYVRLVKATILMRNGEDDEARAIIEAMEEEEFLDETDYYEIAATCNKLGYLEKADEWFKKCLAADPDNEEVVMEYCDNAQELGHYEEAISWYNKMLDKDPYNTELWSELGKAYFHIGEFEKTIEAADFALVSDAENPNAYIYKAHSLYHLGNFPEAIKAYEETLKYTLEEVEYVYLFISSCYVEMESWEKASVYGQKAILGIGIDSPLYPDAMLNSARCLYGLKRYEMAHQVLAMIKDHRPDFIAAYLYGARCYFEQGNRQKALGQLDEAITISPDADTWYQRGMIALEFGEGKIATEAFYQASQLDPGLRFIQDDSSN